MTGVDVEGRRVARCLTGAEAAGVGAGGAGTGAFLTGAGLASSGDGMFLIDLRTVLPLASHAAVGVHRRIGRFPLGGGDRITDDV